MNTVDSKIVNGETVPRPQDGSTYVNGAGLALVNMKKVRLINTEFLNNDSIGYGDGFVSSCCEEIEATGCTFTGNTAVDAGALGWIRSCSHIGTPHTYYRGSGNVTSGNSGGPC